MLDLDKATFIGEGKWVKNVAHQVYEQNGQYYAVTVVDQLNKEVMEELTFEIKEKDIAKYI